VIDDKAVEELRIAWNQWRRRALEAEGTVTEYKAEALRLYGKIKELETQCSYWRERALEND
jgi:hypothetical protein